MVPFVCGSVAKKPRYRTPNVFVFPCFNLKIEASGENSFNGSQQNYKRSTNTEENVFYVIVLPFFLHLPSFLIVFKSFCKLHARYLKK